MPNSSVTLQSVVQYARTFGDLTPVLSAGGYSLQPALTIAEDVMNAMLSAGMPWKWNRANSASFCTTSLQQDYASIALTNLAWMEHAWIVDINNNALPKPVWPLEAVRDLEHTSYSLGRPSQICWLPNDQLLYGTWGAVPGSNGQNNPQAGSKYVDPVGAVTLPLNPTTQIKDPNGNFLVLTQFGTCGGTAPTWPAAAAAAGTQVTDGTCKWTVVDPKGQGFRINPCAPSAGTVYQVNVIAQMRPPRFTSLAQTLEPIPDDFAAYFRRGFIAFCYRHSPEVAVRAKFTNEYQLWITSLREALGKSDRERDEAGFVPASGIMDNSYGYGVFSPANPYGW